MAQSTTPTTQTKAITINLRKRLIRLHSRRRRKRAAGLVREAVARFTKTDEANVRLNKELNEFIQKNASGASFLWARMKVNAEKTGEMVEVKMPQSKAQQQVRAAKPDAKKEEKKEAKANAENKTGKEGKQANKAGKEPKQQKQA